MTDGTPYNYRVFLLRTWEEAPGRPDGQRFSLEDPSTGRRYGFTGTAELARFLEQPPGEEGDVDTASVVRRCKPE